MGRPQSLRFDSVSTAAANIAWHASRLLTHFVPHSNRPTPTWAAGPLPKSHERTAPALGVPRRTQSLCPGCNREAVHEVHAGVRTLQDFRDAPGVIEAQILEESGRVVMRKECSRHGFFEDVLSTDPAFFRRIESLYVGHDFTCTDDEGVHNHGASSIETGRGLALIVDLTNRCNLKCSPCFMDANHAPYVHELSMDDVRHIFDRARSFKPQREFNILFAGGEPTIAQNFLDAVSYAWNAGFKRICVVTNGVRLGQEEDFAGRMRAAGVHQVYLQLDGTSNEAHKYRGAANLFDVKQRALENVASAGMMANLQVAVTKGVNNGSVGDVVRFAVQNIDKVRSVLFQPIMFAGRDALVTHADRAARRYTLADLAHDLRGQTSAFEWQPLRDWFPIAAYSAFGNLFDNMRPDSRVGSMYSDVHPDRGIFSPLLVNQKTKEAVPLSSFVNIDRLLRDVVAIADEGGDSRVMKARLALSVARNFDRRKAPTGLALASLWPMLERFEVRYRSDAPNWSEQDNTDPEWRLLIVAAMWFQDLFVYDMNAERMDATPVATVEGEIAFSAYNAAGWRQIVEHLHQTAPLAEWHKRNGRHEIYANGRRIPLIPADEPRPNRTTV
jgi:7,8-dihydro-6-hydroxymethylpterin dimethyltransferase